MCVFVYMSLYVYLCILKRLLLFFLIILLYSMCFIQILNFDFYSICLFAFLFTRHGWFFQSHFWFTSILYFWPFSFRTNALNYDFHVDALDPFLPIVAESHLHSEKPGLSYSIPDHYTNRLPYMDAGLLIRLSESVSKQISPRESLSLSISVYQPLCQTSHYWICQPEYRGRFAN